jgi:hypothetical protein
MNVVLVERDTQTGCCEKRQPEVAIWKPRRALWDAFFLSAPRGTNPTVLILDFWNR